MRLARGVADDRLALGEDGGHDRVLGAHHATPRRGRAACRAARSAAGVAAVQLDLDAELLRTRGCACRAAGGRSRRRPAAGSTARPNRASSGPASRNDARIWRASSWSSSRLRELRRVDAHLVRARPVASAPTSRAARPSSRRRGSAARSSSVTGSVDSTAAARIGSAPFLFPAARIRPESGRPPSMTNDSLTAWARR